MTPELYEWLLLAVAVYVIVALARQVRSQVRELALADQQLAAKDSRIALLIAEQALLNGRHEYLQACIREYITSRPRVRASAVAYRETLKAQDWRLN